MQTWLALIVAAIINVAIVAYTYGRLSAKVETLTKLVERLCGEHDDIIRNTVKMAEHDGEIKSMKSRFDEVLQMIYRLGRGERVAPEHFLQPPPPP